MKSTQDWKCEKCSSKGSIIILGKTQVQIIYDVLAQHKFESPNCETIGMILLTEDKSEEVNIEKEFAVIEIIIPDEALQKERPISALNRQVKIRVEGKTLIIRNYTIHAGTDRPNLILEIPARSFIIKTNTEAE